MLYRFAKLLAVRAVKLFYHQVNLKNIENIPLSGPIIFTANHPNTMMDPLLIGFACSRGLHFLAKSTLFNRPLNKWFLDRLKIIPVYRRQDNPDEMDKNRLTFEHCYRLLEQGKCILIFPEGVSSVERTLNRIKTGAARIGFGAEERNDFQLGVKIIPVGLNYSDLIRFRSDVYIRFGKPIDLAAFRETYQEDQVEAVHLLTRQVETALEKLTTTLRELDLAAIVAGLESIYKRELIVDMGLKIRDKNDDFAVTKGLIKAVEWFYEHQPERVENFKKLLDRYLKNLDRLHLKDEFLAPADRRIGIWKRIQVFLFLVLGFPVYLLGLINNYLPYQVPRWYTNRFVSNKEWYAPMKLIAGAAVFLLYHGLLITLVALISDSTWITVLYGLTLIPSGNFVLRYVRKAQGYRQHLRFISVFYRKRILIYRIIEQRMQLIHFLNDAKNEYLLNQDGRRND
ncbi:MAG: lysophospholipid acyltransferase family protein [Candidatus Neomarinimicrobiota bacterium]